ncbi:MAG: thiamine phosphate synthase [Clostridia bacterium]
MGEGERNRDNKRGAEGLRSRLRLYLVSDRSLARGRPPEDILRAVAGRGVTAFQLRGKDWNDRELFGVGSRLARLCAELGVLFVVNDRVDIAMACGADGVHLGEDDLPVEVARRLMGKDAIIGASARDTTRARAAQAAGADYVAASPVWATPTKTDAPAPLGLEGLGDMCRAVSLPVIGIGGINAENAAKVIASGAAGVAVVSAIVAAEDPATAARQLREAVEEGERRRETRRNPKGGRRGR